MFSHSTFSHYREGHQIQACAYLNNFIALNRDEMYIIKGKVLKGLKYRMNVMQILKEII